MVHWIWIHMDGILIEIKAKTWEVVYVCLAFFLTFWLALMGKRANNSHVMIKSAIETIGFGQDAHYPVPALSKSQWTQNLKIYIVETWTHRRTERPPFEVHPELKMT